MHRRALLRAAGLAAGAGLLAACSGGNDAPVFAASGSQPTLNVITASFETLTGSDRVVAFGVLDAQNHPVEPGQLQAYLRRAPREEGGEGEVVLGPVDPEHAPPEATGQGVFWFRTDLEEAGVFEVVAVDGDDWGASAIAVRDPADSPLPVPGDEAPSAPTATTANELGVFDICTNDPECGMHEMSLDEALAAGRPIVLLFATPQFCQTAVCGPAVATLESVRTARDHGDVVFIHSEIYATDPTGDLAGAELVPAVTAWGLQSEPFLFTIDADGRVVDRLDGPMPQAILEDLVDGLGTA